MYQFKLTSKFYTEYSESDCAVNIGKSILVTILDTSCKLLSIEIHYLTTKLCMSESHVCNLPRVFSSLCAVANGGHGDSTLGHNVFFFPSVGVCVAERGIKGEALTFTAHH